jgi:hypothetical protein
MGISILPKSDFIIKGCLNEMDGCNADTAGPTVELVSALFYDLGLSGVVVGL